MNTSPNLSADYRQKTRSKPRSQTAPNRARENASYSLAKRGLRIGRTSVGKGVFATKSIADGSFIGQIQGLVINDDMYVSRYSFDLEDGQQLEPEYPFRFINHSCEPNCAFQSFPASADELIRADDGSGDRAAPKSLRRILLFAICDICVGQELTIDYCWPASFAIPCHCRAEACRGWIVTQQDLPLILDTATHCLP